MLKFTGLRGKVIHLVGSSHSLIVQIMTEKCLDCK